MDDLFCREFGGIFRLRVPFENLYTSVFLIETKKTLVLVDTGTRKEDVDCHILPALRASGYALSDVRQLVLTHHHTDHAGGVGRMVELFPQLELVSDVRPLADGLSTYALAGHTADCIGVFDAHTHTLITGDGLQGAGIGRYRCSLEHPDAYLKTLETIRNDRRIENLLFSHAYEPWCVDRMVGFSEVRDCLNQCTKYVRREP